MRFLFLISFFASYISYNQDTLNTKIVSDSIGNEIFLVLDEKEQPLHFFSPIFTPVCVDGSCYPINIIIYWNLAGNYMKYELPKNEILTKIEHLPFTEFDYGLLHRMIEKSPSALSKFSIYELTIEDKNSKVDGVTGATRPELSGSFVPDALYTTYTLWHLVRRPSAELFAYTESHYFNEQWQDYMMTTSGLGCRELFIYHLTKNHSSEEKFSLLFNLIAQYPNNFPYQCISQFKDLNLSDPQARRQLIKWYSNSDNDRLKSEVLHVWSRMELTKAELSVITSSIGKSSSCFEDELQLIDAFNPWPEEQYERFYERVTNQRNMMRKEKMMQVLNKRSDSYPKKFKKLLKKS